MQAKVNHQQEAANTADGMYYKVKSMFLYKMNQYQQSTQLSTTFDSCLKVNNLCLTKKLKGFFPMSKPKGSIFKSSLHKSTFCIKLSFRHHCFPCHQEMPSRITLMLRSMKAER